MRWIRLPWLPFWRDLLTKGNLIGILPMVFVVRMGWSVLTKEKSLGCEEPTSRPVLSWLPFHSFSIIFNFGTLSLFVFLGWRGLYYQGLAGTISTEIGMLTSLTDLWVNFASCHLFGECFCGNLTLWASFCCRILINTSLSGTIPTEIGMPTSLTFLWVNFASCHLFGECFCGNLTLSVSFSAGVWITTNYLEASQRSSRVSSWGISILRIICCVIQSPTTPGPPRVILCPPQPPKIAYLRAKMGEHGLQSARKGFANALPTGSVKSAVFRICGNSSGGLFRRWCMRGDSLRAFFSSGFLPHFQMSGTSSRGSFQSCRTENPQHHAFCWTDTESPFDHRCCLLLVWFIAPLFFVVRLDVIPLPSPHSLSWDCFPKPRRSLEPWLKSQTLSPFISTNTHISAPPSPSAASFPPFFRMEQMDVVITWPWHPSSCSTPPVPPHPPCCPGTQDTSREV